MHMQGDTTMVTDCEARLITALIWSAYEGTVEVNGQTRHIYEMYLTYSRLIDEFTKAKHHKLLDVIDLISRNTGLSADIITSILEEYSIY